MSHNFDSNYKEREFKDLVLKTTMDKEELHKLCYIVHIGNHYVTCVASPTIKLSNVGIIRLETWTKQLIMWRTRPRRRKLLKCFRIILCKNYRNHGLYIYNQLWYMDSRCSNHVTKKRTKFVNVIKKEKINCKLLKVNLMTLKEKEHILCHIVPMK
jgi:hypothetical protein